MARTLMAKVSTNSEHVPVPAGQHAWTLRALVQVARQSGKLLEQFFDDDDDNKKNIDDNNDNAPSSEPFLALDGIIQDDHKHDWILVHEPPPDGTLLVPMHKQAPSYQQRLRKYG